MKKFGKSKLAYLSTTIPSFTSDFLKEEEQFDSQYLLNQQYQRLKKSNEENNCNNENLTENQIYNKKFQSKKMLRLSELEASNLYNTLNVNESASLEDIKKAYKRLCTMNHPDKGGNADDFRKITDAYQILSLPLTRSIFDAFGSRSLRMINSIIVQNKLNHFNHDKVNQSIQQGDMETLACLFEVSSH